MKTKFINNKNTTQYLRGMNKQVPKEFLRHLDIYIETKLRTLAETSYNKKRLHSAVWNLVLPIK
jgi:hypothetical protein